jgi:hypothetical protein
MEDKEMKTLRISDDIHRKLTARLGMTQDFTVLLGVQTLGRTTNGTEMCRAVQAKCGITKSYGSGQNWKTAYIGEKEATRSGANLKL